MDTTTQASESSSAIVVHQSPPISPRNSGKRRAVDNLDDKYSARRENKRENANRVFADRFVPPITAEEATASTGPTLREKELLAKLEEAIDKMAKSASDLQAEQKKNGRLREEKSKLETDLEAVYKGIRDSNARSQAAGAVRNKGFEDIVSRLRGERNHAHERADKNHFTLLKERDEFQRAYANLDQNNTLLYNAHQALLVNGGREGYITEQRAQEMVEEAKFRLKHDLSLLHNREAVQQINIECEKAVKATRKEAENLFLREQVKARFEIDEEKTAKEAALKQAERLQKALDSAGTNIAEVPVEVIVEKIVCIDRPVPELVRDLTQAISSSPPSLATSGIQEILRPSGTMVCMSTQTIEPLLSSVLTITIGGVQETPEEYPQFDERLAEMIASHQKEVAELQALLSESQSNIARAEESASQLAENHSKELVTIGSALNDEIARLAAFLTAAEAPKSLAEMLKLGYLPITKNFHGMKKSTLLENYLDKDRIFLPLSEEEYQLKQVKAAKQKEAAVRRKIQDAADTHYQWLIDFKYRLYNDKSPPPPPTQPYEELLDVKDDLRKHKELVSDRRRTTLQEELDATSQHRRDAKKRTVHIEKKVKDEEVEKVHSKVFVAFAVTATLTTYAISFRWLVGSC